MALPTPRARSYDEALLAAARGVLQRLSGASAPRAPAAGAGV
jgi:hypothetical protein